MIVGLLRKILRRLPDKLYLRLVYFKHFRRFINFKNPKTFNEKIQWLKLNDRNPEYTKMVDKYLVKEFVASKIGDQYIIPTLGMWTSADDIDFSRLPNQFVLKWNYDSGSVVICKDKSKLDTEKIRKRLSRQSDHNGFWYGREWPYKNVKPCIIAEMYLSDNEVSDGLTDYKIHCFGGEPKFILVCSNRFAKTGLVDDFYDVDWNKLDIRRPSAKQSDSPVEKPVTLNQMLELAKVLSANIPFARIDFYEVNGKIYFGEITFFPGSGFISFVPSDWDEILGSMIHIENAYALKNK